MSPLLISYVNIFQPPTPTPCPLAPLVSLRCLHSLDTISYLGFGSGHDKVQGHQPPRQQVTSPKIQYA